MEAWAWAGAALSIAAFALTAFNTRRWPRGRTNAATPAQELAVLVPARNEEQTIEACVRSALATTTPPASVIVCDDGSTDRTRAVVDDIARHAPSVYGMSGAPLPPGWIGKPFACWQLANHPRALAADVLVFVDADTQLEPDGLARLMQVMHETNADLCSAVPRQHMVTWAERLVLPLLHVVYTSWLPIPLIWRSRDPRFVAANGQLLAIRRAAYDQLGGHTCIRSEVVDDVALCRRAKSAGLRVAFADGHLMASCRMYQSAGEVWRGFSKNVFEGLGGRYAALLGVSALFLTAYVLPYAWLAASFWSPALLLPGGVGVSANVGLRAILAARHRQPWSGLVAHPLSVMALLAIAFHSAWWVHTNRISWRGRTYARREAREPGQPSAGSAAVPLFDRR